MPDVTADLKTRYSIFVPKPLARINLGDWQKREGTAQSPKFGYSGVSIQSDANLFFDVTKGTYHQLRGGLVLHTTDWFQCSSKAMYLATADNATVGVDGVITVAAGAGQSPTWTLDHGDAMETVPYINLQLHYRVEEVQNSLFEFFRGRRDKDDPIKDLFAGKPAAVKAMWKWEVLKREVRFNSSLKKPFWDLFGKDPKGAKEVEQEKDLRGGFERIVDVSWQALYGKDGWDYDQQYDDAKEKHKKLKKIAPYDLFAGIKDVRSDLDASDKRLAAVQGDVDSNAGKATKDQLTYGFSGYFSRFDPYLLIDPSQFDDDKYNTFERIVCKGLAYLNNATVKLKRTVDVMYKVTSVIKDNAVMKAVQNAAAAVDAANGEIKAVRGNLIEMGEMNARHDRGWLGDQFQDEWQSGAEKRGKLADKLATQSSNKSTAQATVRSGAPAKSFEEVTDPYDPSKKTKKDVSKGFFGGGRQLANGDQLTITADGRTYTTPPLNQPFCAQVQTGKVSTDAWDIPAGTQIKVKIDGVEKTVNLPAQTILAQDDAAARDLALLKEGKPAHFVTDRQNALASVQQAIANGVGSGCTIDKNGNLCISSATTGASSTIALTDSNPAGALSKLGLGPTQVSGAPIPNKKPEDITADDLVTLFKNTPGATGNLNFTAEDGGVAVQSAKQGAGSHVHVEDGGMAKSLDFKGDFRGNTDDDEIVELGEDRRKLDDFGKANDELQKLPDDMGNLVRPAILLYKNAASVVTKAQTLFKAIAKMPYIKLPTTKGAIGLIANKGISLGTPDRIVGSGGQGVIFVADGGAGNPDHAKYVPLEDTINRIINGDLLAKYEAPKVKDSLGFRVFSDTTADLVARNTAHVVAMGRSMINKKVVGSGVVRVGASYGVEVAAQERVVIGAREKDLGRVEVLGRTVALGYTKVDVDDQRFGLPDRGDKIKGWPADLGEQHTQTSNMLLHSNDQACIVVGPYMVELRSKEGQDAAKKSIEARIKATKARIADMEAQLEGLPMQLLFAEESEWDDVNKTIADVTKRLVDENQELVRANAALAASAEVLGEGIFISMRDPDTKKNTATTNLGHEGKPSIYLNDKGITITTMLKKDDSADTARITLDDKGVTIKVGADTGVMVEKKKVSLTDGSKTVTLTGGNIDSNAQKITFASATKILLG